MNENIKKLNELIDKSKYIVVITGAGVSTASGIPDFRGEDGIYSEKFQGKWNNVFEINTFVTEPKLYYDFFKSSLGDFKPNIVHETIASLEKNNKVKAVITQNIDGLHQRAGSKNVLELHGTADKYYCMSCGKEYNTSELNLENIDIPKCECKGLIRPKVTMFGEQLDNTILFKSIKEIKKADLLIVAGSSLTVYPAAGLIHYFNKDNLVILNKQVTPFDSFADLVIHDDLVDICKGLKV